MKQNFPIEQGSEKGSSLFLLKLLKTGFWFLKHTTKLKYPTQLALGRFIGRRVMQLDQEHSRIAAINIDTCFPILSPQQNRELLLEHFENVGMGIVEMAISWWMPDDKFKQLIHVKGLQNLENALSHGKGVILASAQFTTPDILSRCLGKLVPVTEIYHPHRIESVDEQVRTHRKHQVRSFLMHEDLKAITDTLKQNRAVLIRHDMTPGHKQFTFANFFNISAATNTAVSRFARMTKATVLPVTVLRRENNEGYNLIIESPLPGFPGDSIESDTLRLNLAIERWVDKEPAQYGWSYPRFRERPPGEPRFY
ncbi:MAG: lipid A biosynthesis lauroyl acyltransferase [Gammaproteobacteria bacterium]|nr:lipid A biosynthesis lauroyl acyltransferase [Gammaproteobacteria bacterium]